MMIREVRDFDSLSLQHIISKKSSISLSADHRIPIFCRLRSSMILIPNLGKLLGALVCMFVLTLLQRAALESYSFTLL
jgi:hypothetical protein